MITTAIFATILVAGISAQRSPYAGSGPIGVPQLHARFRTENDTNDNNVNVGNRINTQQTDLPIDARGDSKLIEWISQWPEENQPFWFKNYKHIESQRGKPTGAGGATSQMVGTGNIKNVMESTQSNLNDRFDEGNDDVSQSFTITMSGGKRRYTYNALSDSWIRSG